MNRDHVVTIPTKGKPRSHKAVIKAIFEREKVRSAAKERVFLCAHVCKIPNKRTGSKEGEIAQSVRCPLLAPGEPLNSPVS